MNALERCFEANRLLRSITAKSHDAANAFSFKDEDAARPIVDYVSQEVRALRRFWPIADSNHLRSLEEAVATGTGDSMLEAAEKITLLLAEEFDEYAHSLGMSQSSEVIEGLLHPSILESSYAQFRAGHYRDAVLNSIVAIFDLIRRRSGLDKDGSNLVNEAFSLDHPLLVFSNLDSESGQNDQKGFMEILRGAYQGIRNPKAHSLYSDLDEHKAAQYLVFASLLARRVTEAVSPVKKRVARPAASKVKAHPEPLAIRKG